MKGTIEPITIAKVKRLSWFDDRWYKFDLIDGTKIAYPSVTSILNIIEKKYLLRFYGTVGFEEARRRMREAGDHGSIVHAAIQIFTQGGVVAYQYPRHLHVDDELREQNEAIAAQCLKQDRPFLILEDQWEKMLVDRFEEWYNTVNPIIHETETTVYSHKYRTAGTADNISTLKAGAYMVAGSEPVVVPVDGRAVGDYKTGANLGREALMQVAHYAYCVEQGTGETVDYTYILHLQADTRSGIPGVKMILRNRAEWQADNEHFLAVKSVFDIEHAGDEPKVLAFRNVSMRKDVTVLLPQGRVLGAEEGYGAAMRTDNVVEETAEDGKVKPIGEPTPLQVILGIVNQFPAKTQKSMIERAFGEGTTKDSLPAIVKQATPGDLFTAIAVLQHDEEKIKEIMTKKKEAKE